MSETDPGTEAFASPVTGWIVSTGTSGTSPFNSQNEQAASTFTGGPHPDGSIDTSTGDCLRTTNQYTGDFANANWVISFCVRANSSGSTHDGRVTARLFRSANADGSSATQITSAIQNGTTVTDLLTSATQTSTVTFNPGAFSVNNEYIFVQLGWERLGAGPMTTSDVNMRVGNASGNGTRVVSSNFFSTAVADSDGVGASSVVGTAVTAGVADSDGVGGSNVVGEAVVATTDADADADGVGGSSVVGTAVTAANASTAAGTGGSSVVGSSTAESTAAASGTGASNVVGASIFSATASASGTGASN